MRWFWSAAIAASVALVGASTASGQQGREANGRIRFDGLDTNRDGVIRRSEWRGNDRSFRNHDWNGDGVLSGPEVGAAGGQYGRSDRYDDTDWSEARFSALDRNQDGRISRREWTGPADEFDRIDRNRDGFIALREFLGYDSDDGPWTDDGGWDGSRFDALDWNRDGRISRDEWRGDLQQFDWLDRNHNGYLERGEVNGASARDTAGRDEFDGLDVNGDRVVSRDEWPRSWSEFSRLDRNGDGVLTRAEFAQATGQRRDVNSRASDAGYARGIEEGRQAGREDRTRNHWDLDGQRELERADSGYQPSVGSLTDYQAGYREGFRIGYGEGFGR